ncbi:MAG: hypothetical protein ACFB3T_03220 [Geminicoccaceae bacterium]
MIGRLAFRRAAAAAFGLAVVAGCSAIGLDPDGYDFKAIPSEDSLALWSSGAALGVRPCTYAAYNARTGTRVDVAEYVGGDSFARIVFVQGGLGQVIRPSGPGSYLPALLPSDVSVSNRQSGRTERLGKPIAYETFDLDEIGVQCLGFLRFSERLPQDSLNRPYWVSYGVLCPNPAVVDEPLRLLPTVPNPNVYFETRRIERTVASEACPAPVGAVFIPRFHAARGVGGTGSSAGGS